MIDPLLDLPGHIRQRLESALRSGLLAPPFPIASVRSVVNAGEASSTISEALVALNQRGLPGTTVAEMLAVADRIAARAPRLDLVWSGPTLVGLHARNTRQVYEELLGSAERSVWASTYAFFDGPSAFEVLAKRMDATPGLKVTLLLNVQRKRGDTTAADQLVRRFADRFWNHEWPGAARPRVFYNPCALDPNGPGGVLHAKAVVIDDQVVFITSANLTEAALDSNIELGLLVRDRALAASVSTHFQALIDQSLLLPIPSQ
jgi:phosphatidylserine/phosphatidylglycerophosphate/cardiolipin synthase-like enzyme